MILFSLILFGYIGLYAAKQNTLKLKKTLSQQKK